MNALTQASVKAIVRTQKVVTSVPVVQVFSSAMMGIRVKTKMSVGFLMVDAPTSVLTQKDRTLAIVLWDTASPKTPRLVSISTNV